MPEIGRISGAAIKVYLNDHPPPHIHVHYQGREIRLRITDGKPLDPTGEFHPRVLRDARDWLQENRDTAAKAWAKCHDFPEHRGR